MTIFLSTLVGSGIFPAQGGLLQAGSEETEGANADESVLLRGPQDIVLHPVAPTPPPVLPPARGKQAVEKALIRDDEDRLAGAEWRQKILPEVLRNFGYQAESPWDLAFKALADSKSSVPLKIIALRVMGDNLRELNTLERLLKTLELIANVAEFMSRVVNGTSDRDARLGLIVLAQMAAALLDQINRPPVDVTLTDFSLRTFFDSALAKETTRVWLINGRSAPADEVKANRDRIKDLKARVLPLLFIERREEKNESWNAAWPPWYGIIPDLFGKKSVNFKNEAAGIFADRTKALWERGLALVYYSFRIHVGFDSAWRAAALDFSLQDREEDPLLKQMATAVSENVDRQTKIWEARIARATKRRSWIGRLFSR